MKRKHEREIKQLKEKEKEYEDAIDVLERDNGRLESECVELQKALIKMNKDFQHEIKQHEQLSYKYSLLEKQSQAATNTELLQNSDRKKELMDLNHKVEELMKQKDILHTQNESLCRSLTTKDEELHCVMDEKRQLLQQVKGTDSMKVSDLKRKLTKVKQELAELRADYSALQQDNQLLQNKFYHMEEEMKMDQENKSDEQKMELSQLRREVAALQREKSDLIKKAELMKLKCQKTADENVLLRSKTERGSSAERELSSLKQEIKKLQKQQSTVTLERDSLKSENETLSELFENQKHQNQLHGKKILELNDAIERLDRDNKELQNQNQQLMLQ